MLDFLQDVVSRSGPDERLRGFIVAVHVLVDRVDQFLDVAHQPVWTIPTSLPACARTVAVRPQTPTDSDAGFTRFGSRRRFIQVCVRISLEDHFVRDAALAATGRLVERIIFVNEK